MLKREIALPATPPGKTWLILYPFCAANGPLAI
jgi:hypothetical protein